MKISKYFSMLIAGFVIIVFTTVGVASEESKHSEATTTEVEAAAKVESEAESKEEIQHGAKPESESESGKKEAKAEEKE